MKKKHFLVIALLVGAFLVGYGSDAKAWPFFGRNQFYGYFNNQFDSAGTDVLPRLYDGGANAIPNYVDSAGELISFIEGNLSGSNQQRIGASFIIDSMLGGDHIYPLSAQDIAQWESDIYFYEAAGWINWNLGFNHSYNSMYQGGGGGGPNDDAFFAQSQTSTSITFTGWGGFIHYGIRRQCANPVGTGGFTPLDHKSFSTHAYTTVSNASPAPGSTVTFRHYVVNDGPSSVWPQTMWWIAEKMEPAPQTTIGGPAPDGFYDDVGNPHNVFTHDVAIPASAVPGARFCERVGWTPVNSSGGANGRGTPVCAIVAGSYNLNPSVSSNQTTVQQGDVIQFTYRILNTGSATSPSATCSVRDAANNPVTVPGLTCPQTFAPSAAPGTQVGQENFTVTNESPGTNICRQLSVAPATPSVANRSSGLVCVIVAKSPYVHFMGGDVWAGGGFTQTDGTCTTNTAAKITTSSRQSFSAGSVVEYAAFALGDITKFGSGSRPLYDSASFADLGRILTFSNNTTTLGRFGAPQHCMDDYAANYESATPISGTVDLNRASGSWHSTGSLTLSGTLPAGSQQVYLVDGDVTISNNIQYVGANPSYSNPTQIPHLLIIAKGNIFVDQGVGRIDGVFVTRNTFFTCRQKPMPPTISTCASLLTVTGSVIAKQLDLYRTRGADGATPASRQLPAEIFNLSPEVFLHNVLNNSSQSTITTSDKRELPPRF